MSALQKVAVAALVFVLPTLVHAEQSDETQHELLKMAQKYSVEKKKLAEARAGEGSSLGLLGVKRRFFRPGETWSVTFTPTDNPMSRMTTAEGFKAAKRAPNYFDYQVTEVDEQGSAHIRVRQRVGAGINLADPTLDHMTLVVNKKFICLEKTYFYSDGRRPVTIKLNGQTNLATGFSAYPIEIPSLVDSDGIRPDPKTIPGELAGKIDVTQALAFDSRDIYARPILTIWRDGEVWPVYTKSAAGVALLVSGGAQ